MEIRPVGRVCRGFGQRIAVGAARCRAVTLGAEGIALGVEEQAGKRRVVLGIEQRQRFIDRWAGIPLCAAVSSFDAVRRRIRPAPATDKAPRAIVVILLSEMGSLVLANDMFARLKARYPDAPLHALLSALCAELDAWAKPFSSSLRWSLDVDPQEV